jgi:16S rRNA processing protein RimM
MNNLTPIGTIRKTHGTNGELQALMNSDLFVDSDPEFIILEIDAIKVPFRVLDWRSKGDDVLLRLRGVNTEQAANRLVGAPVFMENAAEQEDTIMTWQDLIGLRVVDEEQGEQGAIDSVDESTANTLLFLDNGRVLPIHEDFIVAIDDTTLTTHYTFLIQ